MLRLRYRKPYHIGGLFSTSTRPYWSLQSRSAEDVVAELRDAGVAATSFEADLRDASAIPALFDFAESALGPVEILVNNAAASDADTFVPERDSEKRQAVDGFGMSNISPEIIDQVFGINSRAPALMMAEFARRHVDRGAG